MLLAAAAGSFAVLASILWHAYSLGLPSCSALLQKVCSAGRRDVLCCSVTLQHLNAPARSRQQQAALQASCLCCFRQQHRPWSACIDSSAFWSANEFLAALSAAAVSSLAGKLACAKGRGIQQVLPRAAHMVQRYVFCCSAG
jgi:hypothetical protein